MNEKYDFLVIGSGLAGLFFALKASKLGKVLILSKTESTEANSSMAQGGIASVSQAGDTFEKHIKDTLVAGAGLCNPEIVKKVVESGPDRIQELIDWGVHFDMEAGHFELTREGGHSERRILHIADQTGFGIHSHLLQKVKENKNIEIKTNALAVELITRRQIEPYQFKRNYCHGAYVLDIESGHVSPITAKATVLATGGAGKTYLYTSNWSGATGDGIAMAFRAGARIANMEFMQFHPTCLYHPNARNFLISEALRGEGGELVLKTGQAFMQNYHKLKSLAPRDIVARSIDAEIKKSGDDCVFLDMTHKSRDYLQTRFPNIYRKCHELNIDIANEPIPVVPAAHYLCGGTLTDFNGRTDVPGLFAVGETACTGLHGANRLASNSLLECIVFSHQAYEWIEKHQEELTLPHLEIPQWHLHEKDDSDELIAVSHMWEEVRRLMWNYVGIVRSQKRLNRALNRIHNIKKEISEYYTNFKTHADIVELRNITMVADLTVQCALMRNESRGIHFNIDCPNTNDRAVDSIINPESMVGYNL